MESISRDFPRFLLNLGGFSSVTFTQFDYEQKTPKWEENQNIFMESIDIEKHVWNSRSVKINI